MAASVLRPPEFHRLSRITQAYQKEVDVLKISRR